MNENCRYASIPKNNHDFWKSKLEGNVQRDKQDYIKLENIGINVIVVLGCEIKQMMKDKMIEQEKADNLANYIFFYAKIRIMARLFSPIVIFHSQILQNGYEKSS